MSLLEKFVLLLIPLLAGGALFLRSKFFTEHEEKISFHKFDVIIIIGLIAFGALGQYLFGREILGNASWSHLISLDIYSQYNSQTLFDAYVFSHIIHGFIFFYFFRWLFKKSSVGTWAILAVTLEVFWEVLENTNMVVNYYRSATISLNYIGDSILNSTFDSLYCLLGFYIATKLPIKYVFLLTVLMEIGALLWVRDNLTLNIIMLLYPLQSIKNWQTPG